MTAHLWPDVATGRAFLRQLVQPEPGAAPPPLPPQAVADWCVTHGIGPTAQARWGAAWPDLAAALAADGLLAEMETALYTAALVKMLRGCAAAGIRVALLKGAALAQTAYPQPHWRTMSDVDVWVDSADIPRLIPLMRDLGFVHQKADAGPPVLSAYGKIKYNEPGWTVGGLEVHVNPFSGALLNATAAVDLAGMWGRIRPITVDGAPAACLAVEDQLIHVAVHLAVGNQFGLAAVRGLLDLAFAARSAPVDWPQLSARARAWRVGTPVWLALSLLPALLDVTDAGGALDAVQPSPARRRALRYFVDPPAVLAGRDWRARRARYLFLALLVDRPRDVLTYVRHMLT